MIGLLLALVGLAKNFLSFKTTQGEQKGQQVQQERALFWQYQTAFIQYTSDIETRIVRQLIVLAFAAALFSPTWGATLTANAKAMPVYGWFILLWEFVGAAALNIIPWYKNGNGNGGSPSGNGLDPLSPDPALVAPIAPTPTKAPSVTEGGITTPEPTPDYPDPIGPDHGSDHG